MGPGTADRAAYDLAVIGGGVNGCGIARDAAGRGASVILFEQNDLASGTSSASTKLIHGGLRYLELYEFRLVREALQERDVLWRVAPHIIWPMRFVLPHHRALRPRWLLRIGLFLYDHLGGKLLPGSRSLDLTADVEAGVRGVCHLDAAGDDGGQVGGLAGGGPPALNSRRPRERFRQNRREEPGQEPVALVEGQVLRALGEGE